MLKVVVVLAGLEDSDLTAKRAEGELVQADLGSRREGNLDPIQRLAELVQRLAEPYETHISVNRVAVMCGYSATIGLRISRIS